MKPEHLEALLRRVADGSVDPLAALDELRELPFTATAHTLVDSHRELRTGIPEIVFGQGKTQAQIADIAAKLRENGQSVLVTRIAPDSAAWVASRFTEAVHHPESRTLRIGPALAPPLVGARVAIVSAGTSDRPVADEAEETLAFLGVEPLRVDDVGVAGLHRLLAHVPRLRLASAAIVVAGMEGALPSVVGGLVDFPVIAVPTSVGYGASFGGLTALLAMMNSCAAGVTVVNIDNGFGAAVAAALVLRTAARGARR
jgi:NCAIR mutase (PurE)-related protein